jgi:hypothetical protein
MAEKTKPDDHGPKQFQIQIDRTHYTVTQNPMTGAQLRHVPPAPIGGDRDLFEIVPGSQDRKIEDATVVEISNGTRFFTAPAHINPGMWVAMTAPLPAGDVEYLGQFSADHEVLSEANMTCVVLPHFQIPGGYDRAEADLLLRLNPGYPDVPPDMWWFNPPVRLADGRPIAATDATETYLGRSWQRWSRHLNSGQWRSGIDNLQTFIARIGQDLARYAGTRWL